MLSETVSFPDKVTLSWGFTELMEKQLNEWIVWIVALSFAVVLIIIFAYNIYSFVLRFPERRENKRAKIIRYKYGDMSDIIKAKISQSSGKNADKQYDLLIEILTNCQIGFSELPNELEFVDFDEKGVNRSASNLLESLIDGLKECKSDKGVGIRNASVESSNDKHETNHQANKAEKGD